MLVADPVGLGLVQSLARPSGNITGFGAVDPPIIGKWLQLLKDVDPAVSRASVIFNPDTQPCAQFFDQAIEAAAPSIRVTITLAPVRDDAAIEELAATQRKAGRGSDLSAGQLYSLVSRRDQRRGGKSQVARYWPARLGQSGRSIILLARRGRAACPGCILH